MQILTVYDMVYAFAMTVLLLQKGDTNIHSTLLFVVEDNFLKYYRGLVYLSVHKKCSAEEFIKWLESRFVTKTTVYRYMAFSALIVRFPRLVLCDLKFQSNCKP